VGQLPECRQRMTVFSEFFITMLLAFGASGLSYLVLARARASTFAKIRLPARWADRAVMGLVVGYSLLFSTLTVLRYLSFNIGYLDHVNSWDLAQYDQIIWNSLHGRLFENSFFPDAPNFLGKSFTPILAAFVPLYSVWHSPIVLLVVQTLALAAGALPLYWFARARLGYGLGVVMVMTYLLSPALQNTNIAEFHEVALLTPCFIFTLFFLLRRHLPGFFVCLTITLLVKEEAALLTVMLGVYIFLFQRRRWLGSAVTLFGIAWTVFLLQYLIPYFQTGQWGGSFYYFSSGSLAGGGARYAYLGKTIPEILTTLVTRPDIVAAEVLIPSKMAYVLHLIVPLALLPLIGFEMSALALPTFAYTLLSRYAHQHSLAAAYHAPILPFLFFGAVIGMARLLAWKRPARPAYPIALAVLLLVTSISAYWLEAPGPLARKFQPWRYALNEHTAIGHRVQSLIPPHAGVVAAQNELLAYVSQRRFVYEVAVKDYRQFDYLLADRTRGWYEVHESFWEPYLNSGYFEILADEDDWVVARRRIAETPLHISFGNRMTLLAYTLVPGDSLQGGQTARPIVAWRADAPIDTRYVIQAHLVDRDGHLWKSDAREPQDGALPTHRWQVGQIVPDQYRLHIDHTAPSGDYRITLRVYDPSRQVYLEARDDKGNPLGAEVTLTTLKVQKSKASVTASQIEIEHRLRVDMGELRLLGFVPPRRTIRAGELFQMGLYWRAHTQPRGDYFVVIELREVNGRGVFERAVRPANGTYPTTQWDAGEVLLDWHDFNLPPDLAAGEYHVIVKLREATDARALGEFNLATLTVLP